MRDIKRFWALGLCLSAVLALGAAAALAQQTQAQLRSPDVIYVPTPPAVVEAMLKMADVKKGDIHYDLGSGDGRIAIMAAERFGARSTGIDIDPQRIKEANENLAKSSAPKGSVRFLNQDLFTTDFSDATVITLYLLPSLNEKLKPQLFKLRPGTRIVSHAFDMGDWKPEKTQTVEGKTIYYWTIPKK